MQSKYYNYSASNRVYYGDYRPQTENMPVLLVPFTGWAMLDKKWAVLTLAALQACGFI
ncbi:hypothetical protein NADFUDRAFT_81887 [Nadsonia fulvescens var. elongata DSM 6958]|uniref:Uncharacterized protein n=1 Tax=Nadsonia fulvescens var. elongata DSM 6958 TaxID=857566 RepID=A0A1E3PPN9_9ASCO|nr:hypothetical protein NADFUDRAFT_81887 [Nadsonia fulvescens var. elongata DSM 6958]